MSKTEHIGFIGQGWIGKHYADVVEANGHEVVRYALEEPYRKNKEKLQKCNIIFVAVPTPTTPEGFDDRIVREAVGVVPDGAIVVIKSTLVPGTTRSIQEQYPKKTVLFSPEFLSVATAAQDAAHPFSTIIGIPKDTPEYRAAAERVLAVVPPSPYSLVCSSTEAEIVKYAHNGSGYTQIVFFNAMYDLARSLGCRWEPIQQAIEADPLVCNRYAAPVHKSGRGAGGYCFIKDWAALSEQYLKSVGDTEGAAVFKAMKEKNNQLLIESGKDLDILSGVYGNTVLSDVPKEAAASSHAISRDLRLLLCTEAINEDDPILGYFHRWAEEFARHATEVTVVSLSGGKHHLPDNVKHRSLGKESTSGPRFLKRIIYAARFLPYVWKQRKTYDTVFIHLSYEYVLLAGILWKLLGKRVGLWYNSEKGSWRAHLAIRLADAVFYTNPNSYAAAFPHAYRVAMGIDMNAYAPVKRSAPRGSLLFVGRLAEGKKLETILEAIELVAKHHKKVAIDVYGAAHVEDMQYADKVKKRFEHLVQESHVSFKGGVRYDETPQVYATHDIFVHAGSSGGFNKALYEAMAAGCIVVTTYSELRHVVRPDLYVPHATPEALSAAIQKARSLSEEEREREQIVLRAYIAREHALSTIVPAILETLDRSKRAS